MGVTYKQNGSVWEPTVPTVGLMGELELILTKQRKGTKFET